MRGIKRECVCVLVRESERERERKDWAEVREAQKRGRVVVGVRRSPWLKFMALPWLSGRDERDEYISLSPPLINYVPFFFMDAKFPNYLLLIKGKFPYCPPPPNKAWFLHFKSSKYTSLLGELLPKACQFPLNPKFQPHQLYRQSNLDMTSFKQKLRPHLEELFLAILVISIWNG